MSDLVEQKFASLVQPHFAALYRAAMRLTRRRVDAEDLVQEVCLRAYSRLDDLAAVTSSRAWLMRALYHLFIDATRGSMRLTVSARPSTCATARGAPQRGPRTTRCAARPLRIPHRSYSPRCGSALARRRPYGAKPRAAAAGFGSAAPRQLSPSSRSQPRCRRRASHPILRRRG